METAGPPRFLGDPCVPLPCSQTPVGPRTPGPYGASTWPPLIATTNAPATKLISGLNRTALGLAVYAPQGGSPLHHARLASGCWAQLGPAGFSLPAGLQ